MLVKRKNTENLDFSEVFVSSHCEIEENSLDFIFYIYKVMSTIAQPEMWYQRAGPQKNQL